MPLRRRGKIFQAQSQDCRDCYWTNPWRDPLHFIDVNGRRRRKRAVDFSIVFQTLRQKDRGKRQSVLSIYFYRDSSCLLVEFICILNDEESSMSLQTILSAISSFIWGPPPTYSFVRNRTLSHPSLRFFANSLFASCLGLFICP